MNGDRDMIWISMGTTETAETVGENSGRTAPFLYPEQGE